MDKKSIDMDNTFKHLGFMPRRFGTALPVQNIGFIHRKTEWVKRTFSSHNFSFIMKGHGSYFWQGRSYEVSAPCVLTQWPDEPMDYGPDGAWTEIYLIYPPELTALMRHKTFFVEGRPLWHIADAGVVIQKLRELQALSDVRDNVADRIDLVCESMIMESLIAQAPPPMEPGERKIRAVANTLRENCRTEYQYDELAQRCGMSLSTFRRLWLKYLGQPPLQYQTQLRIREGCRLLVETGLPVKEIAAELGFEDPLYFSRRFQQFTGVCPSEYRRRHQPFELPPLSGKSLRPTN